MNRAKALRILKTGLNEIADSDAERRISHEPELSRYLRLDLARIESGVKISTDDEDEDEDEHDYDLVITLPLRGTIVELMDDSGGYDLGIFDPRNLTNLLHCFEQAISETAVRDRLAERDVEARDHRDRGRSQPETSVCYDLKKGELKILFENYGYGATAPKRWH